MAAKKFDISFLDTSVRPQDDFFHFACGGWIKKNPIPATESSWGSFYKLRHDVLRQTHTIVKEVASTKTKPKDFERGLLWTLYRSGMDMKRRNREGLLPLKKRFEKIAALASTSELVTYLIESAAHASGILWDAFVAEDEKKSDRYITYLTQGGLTLPDRDFYLQTDARSAEIRNEYREYITLLLTKGGYTKDEAILYADRILALEIKIARASMDKVKRRQVAHIYNKMTVAALQKRVPSIPWKEYFAKIGLGEAREVVVMQPQFMERIAKMIETTPLATWKAYLTFSLIDDASSYLSKDLLTARFNFYGKVLFGQTKQKPLWKQVLVSVNDALGFIVGKEYVKKHFSKEAKAKIDELVDLLFEAYKERLKNLSWLSPTTKKKALLKLNRMERKLGYPDKWQSYRGLALSEKKSYFENILTSAQYEQKRNFKRLGKKVDRSEWFTPPQTVNAFYNPNQNEIVFPAAILQPPFFDTSLDDAVNFGAMGSVIGHELTHGFDNEGSKFDDRGNYKNWWTPEDRKRFEKKTRVLVKQFNAYKVDDLSVNGMFTLGENIADLGGLVIAYDAYQKHLEKTERKVIRGYTPEQRFFSALAFFECTHARKEWARTLVLIDPHSPARFRVNGPMSNIDAFYEAFSVKPSDQLYRTPKERARIW